MDEPIDTAALGDTSSPGDLPPAPRAGAPGPRRAPLPPDIELEPFTRAELCDRLRGGELEADLCEELLVRSSRARGGVDLKIGEGLAVLRERGWLAHLGFHLGDYAREVLELDRRTAESYAHLAEQLGDRPLLRPAVLAGTVLFSAAQEIVPVAVGEAEAEWVERASRKESVRSLRKAVRAARAAAKAAATVPASAAAAMPVPATATTATETTSAATAAADEAEDLVHLRVPMRPEERAAVDEALTVADALMPGTSRAQRLEAMAQEFLGAAGPAGEDPDQVPLGAAFRAPRPRPDLAAREEELELENDRWSHLPPIPPVPAPEVDFQALTSAEAVDAELCKLVARRKGWQRLIGFAALTLKESRVWQLLGFASFRQYVEERLGLSARSVEERARLEKAFWERPAMRDARSAGLSYAKLLLLSHLPDPQVRAWTGPAGTMTCIALRRALDADHERQMSAQRKLDAPMPRSTAQVLAAAMAAVRTLSDTPLSDGACLARIARHFLEVWRPHIHPPKTRSQKVRARDVWCQVPGCSHRAADAHHKKIRSQGGGDEEENLAGVCRYHHQRCIHEGHLWLDLEAPGGPTWMRGDVVFTGGAQVAGPGC